MTVHPDLKRATATAAALLLRQRLCRLPVDPAALELGVSVTVDTMQNYCAHSRTTMPELRAYADMRDGCSLLVRRGGFKNYVILLNGDIANPARRRFTLAHEIGHIALGHEQDSPVQEAEANCFAAALLLPPVLAWELWQHGGDIALLCGVFGVSKSAAQRRVGGFATDNAPVFTADERALLARYAPLLPRRDDPLVDY